MGQNERVQIALQADDTQKRRFPINQQQITQLLQNTRSAILGTVGERGGPHLVPIVFAYGDGRICTAVDQKPKTTRRLQRLRNIEKNPQVSILLDRYDDDWTRLWWIRIDGTAHILDSGPAFRAGIALLSGKYRQYVVQPPPGPLIDVEVETIRAWSAS
jgi:PPOX class probable F420-dependent enzyme